MDHRSLKDQGIDRTPEPKIGVAASAMKRNGEVADPDAFQRARQVKIENEVMPHIRDIQRNGEIQQFGNGETWWERSAIFMKRVQDKVRDTIRESWQKLVAGRQHHEPKNEPERGMDRE